MKLRGNVIIKEGILKFNFTVLIFMKELTNIEQLDLVSALDWLIRI